MKIQGLPFNEFRARREKFGLGPLFLLLLIGGVFTAAGLFAFTSAKIDPSWPRASGKVVGTASNVSDGSNTYAAIVQYAVKDQAYKVASNTSSSSYPSIGSSREVAYNPERPQEAKVVEGAGTLWFLAVFPAIGIGLLILAPVLFVRSLLRSNRIKNLMQSGQKMQGVLTDVKSPGNGNGNSYTIEVSATDNTGMVRNYVSDPLSGIGGLTLADFRNHPIPIDVYVDPTNSNNYYVDVADIPNLTPERIAELLKSATSRQPADPTPTPNQPGPDAGPNPI